MSVTEPARVLVADPPWKFADTLPGKGRGAAKHYDVLDLEGIKSFPLPELAPDCYLFMWRVAAMVEESYEVVRAWGFTPKAEIIWDKKTKTGKEHFGMGHHVRASHETCIIAVRGAPKPISRSVRSKFDGTVTRHSEKPDEFYEIVEQMCKGPYAEIFARRHREGWQCFGNELEVAAPGDQETDSPGEGNEMTEKTEWLCDCGKPKTRTAECCRDCGFLDGTCSRETRIIDALRMAVTPVNVRELASLASETERSVLRSIKPLTACGRVIKIDGKEGEHSIYKLGEKRLKQVKKQSEIPGFERETDPELDNVFLDLVDAKGQVAAWKATVAELTLEGQRLMAQKEAGLKKNKKGKPCYVLRDGDLEYPVTLDSKHTISVGKPVTVEVDAVEAEA